MLVRTSSGKAVEAPSADVVDLFAHPFQVHLGPGKRPLVHGLLLNPGHLFVLLKSLFDRVVGEWSQFLKSHNLEVFLLLGF